MLALFLLLPLALFQNPAVWTGGSVHVHWPGLHHEAVIAGEPGQVGIDDFALAPDGRTAGWLVLFPDPDQGKSYAGELVIARGDHVMQRFRSGPVYWSWRFVNGSEIAFRTGSLHGAPTSHCELRALANGQLLQQWDGDLDASQRPAWTRGLR